MSDIGVPANDGRELLGESDVDDIMNAPRIGMPRLGGDDTPVTVLVDGAGDPHPVYAAPDDPEDDIVREPEALDREHAMQGASPEYAWVDEIAPRPTAEQLTEEQADSQGETKRAMIPGESLAAEDAGWRAQDGTLFVPTELEETLRQAQAATGYGEGEFGAGGFIESDDVAAAPEPPKPDWYKKVENDPDAMAWANACIDNARDIEDAGELVGWFASYRDTVTREAEKALRLRIGMSVSMVQIQTDGGPNEILAGIQLRDFLGTSIRDGALG